MNRYEFKDYIRQQRLRIRRRFKPHYIVHLFNEISTDWIDYLVFKNGDIYEGVALDRGSRDKVEQCWYFVTRETDMTKWVGICKKEYLQRMAETSEFSELDYYLEKDNDERTEIEPKHVFHQVIRERE